MMLKENVFIRGGLSIGFMLSVASALRFCTEACSEAHKYLFFGIPVSFLGIGFFLIAAFAYELGRVKDLFSKLFLFMIFSASGAELAFIFIQKYRIQKWCPLCLGVAATVFFLAAVLSFAGTRNSAKLFVSRRIMIMPSIKKGFTIISIILMGFFVAYGGMRKSVAEENVPNILLGKQDSQVEVFIMTDWFCPACQKAEEEIERAVLATAQKAKIIFVDVPVHAETMNYTPYNLSFLTYEKNRYLELRKALLSLTKKTKEPTPEDVQGAIAPLNVTYRQLSFLSANNGIKFYDTVTKEFKVNSTPTVIVRNTKTKRFSQLVGVKDITEANIIKAVETASH